MAVEENPWWRRAPNAVASKFQCTAARLGSCVGTDIGNYSVPCQRSTLALSVVTAFGTQGKYDEADELLIRTITIQEFSLGTDDPNLSKSLSSRAKVLQAQVMRV